MQRDCELSCGVCECGINQFECTSFIPGLHDGERDKCIIKPYLCDGDADCPDGEDESRIICPFQQGCRRGQFTCNNGQCIPAGYECDGESIYGHDCDDFSDEHRGCRRQRGESCGWFRGEDLGLCAPGLECSGWNLPRRCTW